MVNHALLLADLARGGGLIPDYRHLIVDEAHHLEDEATRQMGFAVSQETLDESWEPHSRLNAHIRLALNAEGMSSAVRQDGEAAASAVEAEGPAVAPDLGAALGRSGTVPGLSERAAGPRPKSRRPEPTSDHAGTAFPHRPGER